MTTFMSKNPQTSTEETLNESVCSPETSSNGNIWDIFRSEVSVREVECHSKRHDIPSNIVQTSCSGSFEAVFWDGFVNVTDCVIGNLKLVAITIDQLLSSLFLLAGDDLAIASKGREGSRGRR